MNKIIPYLKKADALAGYRLEVEFEDGIKGIIDRVNGREKVYLVTGMMIKISRISN